MNYYNRYPAHYLAKTLLLTLEQDGAYTRLMDWYYAEERGIPHDKRYTVARCQGKREREAADFVLNEFFELVDGLWIHDRIEKELTKAAPKIDAARENGKRGGRPRKEKPSGFQNENPMGFQNETQQKPNAKAPQTPYTNNKSEIDMHATPAGECAIAMRQAGCISLNPSHPDFLAALDEGVAPKEFADAVEEAKGRGISGAGLFTYAIGIARTNHAKTATQITGANHGNATATRGRKLSAVEQVQQAILERRDRESFDDGEAPLAIGHG